MGSNRYAEYILIVWPRYLILREWKKLRYAIQKVQKSSCVIIIIIIYPDTQSFENPQCGESFKKLKTVHEILFIQGTDFENSVKFVISILETSNAFLYLQCKRNSNEINKCREHKKAYKLHQQVSLCHYKPSYAWKRIVHLQFLLSS